jgi:ribosomal protein S1
LEGLIHVSELAEGSFLHPRNVVEEGEHVVARVLHLDGRRRRMALSLRRVNVSDQEPAPEQRPADEQDGKNAPDDSGKEKDALKDWTPRTTTAEVFRS